MWLIYIYIYIYVYMCVCVCVYIHIHTHVNMNMYIYICLYMNRFSVASAVLGTVCHVLYTEKSVQVSVAAV